MKTSKNYSVSPLPFQGQKRRFLKDFKIALSNYPNNGLYIDLFGGSGLLSQAVREVYPAASVIWNDYDDFKTRLENVRETNVLLSDIRNILSGVPRIKRVDPKIRAELLKLIRSRSYVDYVTLSANILFSGKYVTNLEALSKETFYNRVRGSDYNVDGYLEGVERVQLDYRVLFEKYRDTDNVIWLVDPPYLSTDTATYNSNGYWRLRDYLGVLNVLDGQKYFYFTSNKSQIVELCEWVETRTSLGNPFKDAQVSTTCGSVNYSSSYQDIMLFKRR